jgi:hypothetical protein
VISAFNKPIFVFNLVIIMYNAMIIVSNWPADPGPPPGASGHVISYCDLRICQYGRRDGSSRLITIISIN